MADPLEARLKSIEKAIAKRGEGKVIQFSLWGDSQRGVPNDFVRCALFAAAKGIDGVFHENVPVFSQSNLTVTYNGPSLTQDHLDVYEAIMHLARDMPEGNAVRFSAHGLLKLIGRSTGKTDHDRLKRCLGHLTATAVFIKRGGQGTYCGSLLPEWVERDEDGFFSITINRNLIKLFDRGFTTIEWEQRKALARSPLAKFLQMWLSSHDNPHPVTVAFLHQLSGSDTKQLRYFRKNLKAALDSLVRVGVLADWRLDESDKVHFTKA